MKLFAPVIVHYRTWWPIIPISIAIVNDSERFEYLLSFFALDLPYLSTNPKKYRSLSIAGARKSEFGFGCERFGPRKRFSYSQGASTGPVSSTLKKIVHNRNVEPDIALPISIVHDVTCLPPSLRRPHNHRIQNRMRAENQSWSHSFF